MFAYVTMVVVTIIRQVALRFIEAMSALSKISNDTNALLSTIVRGSKTVNDVIATHANDGDTMNFIKRLLNQEVWYLVIL